MNDEQKLAHDYEFLKENNRKYEQYMAIEDANHARIEELMWPGQNIPLQPLQFPAYFWLGKDGGTP